MDKERNWKEEIARDILALGSCIFYALVIARAAIKPYHPFLEQLIIAGLFLIAVNLFTKDCKGYLSRGFVIAFLTTLFYSSLEYTIFVWVIFAGMIASAYYSKYGVRTILIELAVGLAATGLSYYLASIIQ